MQPYIIFLDLVMRLSLGCSSEVINSVQQGLLSGQVFCPTTFLQRIPIQVCVYVVGQKTLYGLWAS